MGKEMVILVNEQDQPKGMMEKLEAHVRGILHRAFSIFVFNNKGELMLQRRALSKYHSPGLWTNTCCSHPRQYETLEEAIHRRLIEEMGFDTELEKTFDFIYKSDVGQGLTEHEFDHVFFGIYEEKPFINKEEVDDWKFIALDELSLDMETHPEKYTVWFRIAYPEMLKFIQQKNSG